MPERAFAVSVVFTFAAVAATYASDVVDEVTVAFALQCRFTEIIRNNYVQ